MEPPTMLVVPVVASFMALAMWRDSRAVIGVGAPATRVGVTVAAKIENARTGLRILKTGE